LQDKTVPSTSAGHPQAWNQRAAIRQRGDMATDTPSAPSVQGQRAHDRHAAAIGIHGCRVELQIYLGALNVGRRGGQGRSPAPL